jgi:membrane protease YdiL (CAAX protease family)
MRLGTAARPTLIPTRVADSLAWMLPDLLVRLVPMSAAVFVVWLVTRAPWLGLGPGLIGVQLAFGLTGLVVLFVAAAAMQLRLTPRRGALRVPASPADVALQAGYFVLNGPVEEAFFRGLVQGGLGTLIVPLAGLAVGTSLYVVYHRLGRWSWRDVAATACVGLPLGLAFWLLPGPPSLLGVSLAHIGATCGFLGPGPWLLRRLRLLE